MNISHFFPTLTLLLLPIFILLMRRRRSSQRLPPGSLGVPIIGQSLGLLWAMRANTAEKWMAERAKKYGPVSKMSLFGKPTVFIYGQAANKFVFTNDGSILSNSRPESVKMILGDRNLMELIGEDHRRVRNALTSFLKPDCLKNYIGKMEEEIREHLEMHWEGKQKVTVLPLMKTLTFDIICTLLFGLEGGARRDSFLQYFQQMIAGILSIPINIPFTRFNHGLKATAEVQKLVKELIQEKRAQLEKGVSSHQDLITCLLSIHGEDNEGLVSEVEIIHNVLLIMVAGYDTSSVLITFMFRALTNDQTVYAAVLKEQEEIRRNKPPGEILTWEDLAKMKYTWRVAQETMRMIPPIFGGFRKTLTDIEYEGYLIPKGWQIYWVTSMTHMDSSIFEEPSKFNPARFENPASIPPHCYVPFGGGARICPGYEFARVETLVTIHYLVTRYAWKLCCSDSSFRRDPMPTPAQGFPVEIMPRNPL
ncbi:hypothetical protein Pfo_013607 [Paulownia fortunei]|nr:hypothetical protein Pfo_013607 [Paulownia fortunei]